jgi:HK97 family phage major capsid protein
MDPMTLPVDELERWAREQRNLLREETVSIVFQRHSDAVQAMERANRALQEAPRTASRADIDRLARRFDQTRDEAKRLGDLLHELDRTQAAWRDSARFQGRDPYADNLDEGEHRAGRWLASELRALTGGSGTGAAFTPSEFASYFFDLLAAQSVGLRSGFRVVQTDRDSLVVPRNLADQSAAWVAEAGTIGPSDPNADSVTLTPRKLAALTVSSNEVLVDSNPAVLDVVAMQMLRAIALKADLGFYEGSGTPPEIRGLKNVVGIQTVSMGANGAQLVNLDQIADAIGLLETANTEAGAIVMHPRSWRTLIKLKEDTAATRNKPLLQDSAGSGSQGVQKSIYGVPVFLSSQLSITETQGTSGAVCSSIYVYAPSEVVVAIRSEARVELDSSRLFNSDQSELRGITRLDMAVPNAPAVCRILGILP